MVNNIENEDDITVSNKLHKPVSEAISIPLVSICCITYNHENYIRDAIEGFLMQKTNFAFEILIHDDASTDRTADIIREYEAKYPELIKPIYQSENQFSKHDGSIGRIQRGRAKGKYIAMCEGDDYWTDELKLQKQVDFLEANEDYSFCAGRVNYLFQDTNEFKDDYQIRCFDNVGEGLEVNLENIFNPYIMRTCTLLYRKDYWDNEAMQEYQHVKDIFLFAVLLSKGKGFVFNTLFGVYRKHSAGIWTGTPLINQLQADIDTLTEMDRYFSHSVKSIIEFRNQRMAQLQEEHKKIKKSKSTLSRFLIKLKINK